MSFQVLFNGEVADDANAAVVRDNLARVLGIEAHKVRALFSGRTVVLRSELSEEAAKDLHRKLADIGAIARVKDLNPESAAGFKVDSRSTDFTLRDITAAFIECPRCTHQQLDAPHCARCGVDMAKAAKQKQKEDLIIERKIRELRAKQATDANADRAGAIAADPADAPEPKGPGREEKREAGRFGKLSRILKSR